MMQYCSSQYIFVTGDVSRNIYSIKTVCKTSKVYILYRSACSPDFISQKNAHLFDPGISAISARGIMKCLKDLTLPKAYRVLCQYVYDVGEIILHF